MAWSHVRTFLVSDKMKLSYINNSHVGFPGRTDSEKAADPLSYRNTMELGLRTILSYSSTQRVVALVRFHKMKSR
jgi:hypothetical protein